MKKCLRIFSVILLNLTVMFGMVTLNAESADYAKLIPPAALAAGEDAEFTLHMTGNGIYGVNGTLAYDMNEMTYIEASIDIGSTWESSFNQTDGIVYFAATDGKYNLPANDNDVITFRFKISENANVEKLNLTAKDLVVSKNGSTVQLSDTSFEMSKPNADNSGNTDEIEEIGESTTTTVVVKKDQTANNNYLKSLNVKNAKISPDFDRETQKYTAKVGYQVKELEVEAEPEAENATVNIIDTELKYVGKNIVRVQVVSESGLKRTYKIYVTRSEKKGTSGSVETGLSVYAIILICVGAVVLLAAAIFTIFFIKHRKNKKQ